jgi:hypothetical protein
MKNILNVIVDTLTLLALCLAGIGHVLPWFSRNNMMFWGQHNPGDLNWLGEFQRWHAMNSGIALGILAFLVCLSLVFNWGSTMRRFLNLAMLASAFAALLFQLLIFSNYDTWVDRPPLAPNVRPLNLDMDVGFYLSVIPTSFAVFFCLVRMLWTMPPNRPKTPAEMDKKPAFEKPIKDSGFSERRV